MIIIVKKAPERKLLPVRSAETHINKFFFGARVREKLNRGGSQRQGIRGPPGPEDLIQLASFLSFLALCCCVFVLS